MCHWKTGYVIPNVAENDLAQLAANTFDLITRSLGGEYTAGEKHEGERSQTDRKRRVRFWCIKRTPPPTLATLTGNSDVELALAKVVL